MTKLSQCAFYQDQIAYVRKYPAKPAQYAPAPSRLGAMLRVGRSKQISCCLMFPHCRYAGTERVMARLPEPLCTALKHK